jgi:hypothetical protein
MPSAHSVCGRGETSQPGSRKADAAVLHWRMLVAWLLLAAEAAPTSPVSPGSGAVASDAAAIRDLVEGQLAAFRARDAAAAWAPVAPSLKARFGRADLFLEMVLRGYAPLADPRSVRFDGLEVLPTGELGQWLHVVGAAGEEVDALYLLERQADGTWRTSGCLLFEGRADVPRA